MKKFQITIPTPCYENWDEMTQQDKGKFCGSCQKTVIDFSTMSDRQIADFFNKPKGSVCGRFHSDQLEREIQIPNKRMPWVKYFFQVTWPALVLFLKSCGQRPEVVGKALVEVSTQRAYQQESYATVGMLLPVITPQKSLFQIQVPLNEADCSTKGEIAIIPETHLMGDTIALSIDTTDEPPFKCYEPMDTVHVVGYESRRRESLIAGGISVVHADEIKKDAGEREAQNEGPAFLVFPNPVRAGVQLTIKLSTDKIEPRQVQLLSANGQVITTLENQFVKGNNFTLSVPSSIVPGNYFLRVITENLQSKTVKILVIN